mgnify:CR=1 FL=1
MKKAKKIGVIHTTPATLQSTEALIKRLIDGAEVMNILDDTILKDMAAQNRVDLVRERWINYAEILEKMGFPENWERIGRIKKYIKSEMR